MSGQWMTVTRDRHGAPVGYYLSIEDPGPCTVTTEYIAPRYVAQDFTPEEVIEALERSKAIVTPKDIVDALREAGHLKEDGECPDSTTTD